VCLFCAYTLAISRSYSQLAAKGALNTNSVISSKLQLLAFYFGSSQKGLLSALGAGGRRFKFGIANKLSVFNGSRTWPGAHTCCKDQSVLELGAKVLVIFCAGVVEVLNRDHSQYFRRE